MRPRLYKARSSCHRQPKHGTNQSETAHGNSKGTGTTVLVTAP